MTETIATAVPTFGSAFRPRTPFGISPSDPFGFVGYRHDDYELSERIIAFNRVHAELELAELEAIGLRESGDEEAGKAEERAAQLLWLATERLKAVFEFQPATLRGALELLFCSIDEACLERGEQNAIMDTRACARALCMIQELTGIKRKLPW